jgi:hypothetical protein
MLGLITAKVRGLPLIPERQRRWRLKTALKLPWILLENTLPDSVALRMLYYRSLGEVLHLHHPITFTEKIQWLKLNYRLPIMQQLADKYQSRAYVAERVGAHVLNELYGVWDRPEEIDFDSLPRSFAIKVSSASHANIFCRDKSNLNIDQTRTRLAEWMQRDYYRNSREWAYKGLEPRIVAEQLLEDGTGQSPADYKFYCFNGKPGLIEVAIGRHERLTITLLDTNWTVLPCSYNYYPTQKKPIPRPKNLDEMLSHAQALAKDFPFARIDFYSIYGKTIFGEITWYPSTGMAPFRPDEFNERFGDMLVLPKRTIGS